MKIEIFFLKIPCDSNVVIEDHRPSSTTPTDTTSSLSMRREVSASKGEIVEILEHTSADWCLVRIICEETTSSDRTVIREGLLPTKKIKFASKPSQIITGIFYFFS